MPNLPFGNDFAKNTIVGWGTFSTILRRDKYTLRDPTRVNGFVPGGKIHVTTTSVRQSPGGVELCTSSQSPNIDHIYEQHLQVDES